MTGYTVHTGSTEKFSDGWDRIFQGKNAGKKKPASRTKSAKKKTKKPAAKKNKK